MASMHDEDNSGGGQHSTAAGCRQALEFAGCVLPQGGRVPQ
eukprot:gene20651-biopygen2593